MLVHLAEDNDIVAVFLNNKRVPLPVSIDEEAGFVDAQIPVPPSVQDVSKDQVLAAIDMGEVADEVAEPEFKTVRLTGTLKVLRRSDLKK